MKSRSILKRRNFSVLLLPLACAAAAFGMIILVISGFSFVITKIDASDLTISVMSTIALCVGAVFGGYISGRKRRKNGLLMGTLCGVFIFLIIFILGTLVAKTAGSFSMSVKLVLTLVSAAIGGVVGVNSRGSKF